MSAALNRICGATRPTSIWREALAGKIVGLFDHTAQSEWFPICALTVNLKCFLAKLLCKVKMGKNKLAVAVSKASVRKSAWTLDTWGIPSSHQHKIYLWNAFKQIISREMSYISKQKQTQTQWKSKWIVLIPKTFSNIKMLFLAPLLTAWSPSHLFPADHFGHLSCHNYAPWTRSANCRLCSAAAFDVIDAWSP